MKTLFIAIAYGTGVRDVLRGDTLRVLRDSRGLRVVILASEASDSFKEEFGGENIFFENLTAIQPTLLERFFHLFHLSLIRKKSATIRLGNTGGPRKSLKILSPIVDICSLILGEKTLQRALSWAYRYLTPNRHYEDIFGKYRPDLVLCTRVLNHSLDFPVLKRAVVERIPVILSVSSWDNLTSKGFFPFPVDHLIVWNKIMRAEAIEIFGFSADKVYVSGIPRYDVFFQGEKFRSRKKFLKSLGLTEHQKYILYATGSKDTGRGALDPTSPEPEICSYIADQLESGAFGKNISLIVRLHPQALIKEYEGLIQRPNVILQVPGEKGAYNDRLFSARDDIEYGETLKHSSLVINLASTASIDAAVFNCPIIGINFDFRGHRPYEKSVQRFYAFDHFKKLVDVGGVTLAASKIDLVKHVQRYLASPGIHESQRAEMVEKQCEYTDGQSGRRVAEFVLDKLSLPK